MSSSPSPVASLRTPLSAESVGPLGLRSHRGTPSRTPRAHSQLAADTQPVCSWLGEAGQGDPDQADPAPGAERVTRRASSDVQGYHRSPKAGSGRSVSGEPRNRHIHASGACTLAATVGSMQKSQTKPAALPDPRKRGTLTPPAEGRSGCCIPRDPSAQRKPRFRLVTSISAARAAPYLARLQVWGERSPRPGRSQAPARKAGVADRGARPLLLALSGSRASPQPIAETAGPKRTPARPLPLAALPLCPAVPAAPCSRQRP
jgi:hypothetical protein